MTRLTGVGSSSELSHSLAHSGPITRDHRRRPNSDIADNEAATFGVYLTWHSLCEVGASPANACSAIPPPAVFMAAGLDRR